MLYLSAIILSFFLSFVLITKKHKTHADLILSAWLATIGFHILTFYLIFTNQQFHYPRLAALGFSLPFTQAPFLYLYARQLTSPYPFRKVQLLHFLPFFISVLLFSGFYFMSFDEQVEIWRGKGKGFERIIGINLYAIYFSGMVYVVLSLTRLYQYRKTIVHQFSNTEKINFNWLLYLIIWMVAIWLVIIFVGGDQIIFASIAVFVIWLGYFGIKQVQVFSQGEFRLGVDAMPFIANTQEMELTDLFKTGGISENPSFSEVKENVKYLKSSLSEEEAVSIHERLKILMAEKKLFKNPDLILNELAKNLEVHPNHLSQVINSMENKNFYDLINEKRVEEFIQLVSEPQNQQFTLLALAYDCGFNSKASFNRNFKKYTGKTPSDFLKQQNSK